VSDVCYLSVEEASAFELYRIRPSHKAHHHESRESAIHLIQADLAREVDGLPAIVAQSSNDRIWAHRPSGGCTVRQLVPVRDRKARGEKHGDKGNESEAPNRTGAKEKAVEARAI